MNNDSDSLPECRACLRQIAGVSLKLFGPWSKSWAVPGALIADDLAKIADIEIQENDKHSKVICSECYDRLADACIFIINVQKTDSILRQRLLNETSTNDCAESNSSWPKPILLNKSINSEMENNIEIEIKQEVLSEEENDSSNMDLDFEPTMDIKIEPEEIVAPVQSNVQLNGYSLKDINEEFQHQYSPSNNDDGEYSDNTIKQEPLSGEDDQETAPDLPLDCMLCMKAFNSVTGLKAHVIAQHSYGTVKRKSQDSSSPVQKEQNEFSCVSCKHSFKTRTDLMVHETCHGKHICFVCDAKFNTFRQLSRHGGRCRPRSNSIKKQSDEPLQKQPRNDRPVIIKAIESKSKVTEMKIELVGKQSNNAKEETKVDSIQNQEARYEHDFESLIDEAKVEAIRSRQSPGLSNEDENLSTSTKESINEPSNNERIELNKEEFSDNNQLVEQNQNSGINKLANDDTNTQPAIIKPATNECSNKRTQEENVQTEIGNSSTENDTEEQSLEQSHSTSHEANIEEQLVIPAIEAPTCNSLQKLDITKDHQDEILHFEVEMAESEQNRSHSLVSESIANSLIQDDIKISKINIPCINEEVPTELLNTQDTENESTHLEQSIELPNSLEDEKESNQQDEISVTEGVNEMKIHLAINPLSENDSVLLDTKMDIEDLESVRSDGCEQKLVNVLNELSDDNMTQ